MVSAAARSANNVIESKANCDTVISDLIAAEAGETAPG